MVRIRYGSALGTFGERLCSPNVPNALPNMVCMRYGGALGTFGEHRRSPECTQMPLECIWVHLESIYNLQMYPMRYHSAYGPYLWSVCTMVAHWIHLESIDALRMHPNALECIWVHSKERLYSPNVPNALP